MNQYDRPQRIVWLTGCLNGATAETLYLSGPASLTEGVRRLYAIVAGVVNCEPAFGLEPSEPLHPDFVRRAAAGRKAAAMEAIPA